MLRKRLHNELRIFFTYTVYQATCAVVLLFMHLFGPPEVFFYTYWASELVSAVLMFFVLYEIFQYVFRGYEGLKDLTSVIFQWALAILFLLAVVSAASSSSSASHRIIDVILVIEKSVRIMQCGMTAFLLIFTTALNLTPRHFVFGLILGFGLLSYIEIAVTYTRVLSGFEGTRFYELLKPGAYVFVTGLWLVYLVQPEPVYQTRRINFELSVLDRWNENLVRIMGK